MLNENCVKSIIFYLDKNMTYKPNGKSRPIKARIMKEDMSASFSDDEFHLALSYLLRSGFITITSEVPLQASPRSYHINSITPAGYQLLSLTKDDNLWEKLKKKLSLEKILDLLSTGINAAQLLQNFL